MATLGVMLGAGCNSVFGIREGQPRPLCTNWDMIDDMEDGDASICRTNGRTGGWFDFGDGTPGELTPKSGGTFTPTRIEDGSRSTSRYAARFAGSGFTSFGAIMGFDLLYPKAAYDASSRGAGITFWMKSNVPVAVDFPTLETTPIQNGGQCVDAAIPGGCNQHFSFQITKPAVGWFAYQVPFNALTGPGSTLWNPQHLLGVNFRVPPGTTFEVWIDDVAFYACAGPECQPTCTDPDFPVSCRIGDGLRSSCRPPGSDCAPFLAGCADPLLIDDMEDGDDAICNSGGRYGGWSSQSDGSGTKLIPATDAVFQQAMIPGGRGTSRFAARLAGAGFTGYALMGFDLNRQANGDTDYDGSKFDGITFSMKSDVPVTLGFTSPQTLPADQGGTCDLSPAQENCRRHFEFAMGATGNAWLDYRVPFSALRQAANRATPFTPVAATATWDASHLRSIAFLTSSPNFDVWIDDIRFYTCATDACLPTCTGDTPVACAASGGRPAGCWPMGTDCSSPPDLVDTGIWGSGANDVWMVGQSTVSWAGAISHWDGAAWTQTPSGPLPPIWGVWGNGANDVWAVADHGIVLHKNDSGWVVSSSNTAGTTGPLSAIWGNGPNDIWGVGGTGIIVHWNGATWAAAATASTPQGLTGVWGSGSDDVWAVGLKGTILHWDGLAWSASPSGASSDLLDVWGGGPGDVWAIGRGGTIVHWNGTTWSASQSNTSMDLMGVWGSGPADVWAVGQNGTLRHWDGSAWHAFASGTRQVLNKVWGSGPNDVWAIGTTILHWDGQAWSASPR